MENTPNTARFDDRCSLIRADIKAVGAAAKDLIAFAKGPESTDASTSDKGEMIANVTIAYRHLEDAAMRLGKAIQAFDGGESIYDSNDAQRVAAAGRAA